MKLADLVDLEWLLADPARLPEDVVQAAQPAAAAAAGGGRAAVDSDVRVRAGVCLALLAAARAGQAALPGRTIARAIGAAGVVLAMAGLLTGAGTALGVLAYDGSTPVNVLHFVLVFVLLQIVLLMLLVWFLLRARGGDGSGPAVPHRFAAWLVDRLLGARGREAAEALRVLRTRHSLYGNVEKWTLFELVQRFGVAFNVAALATLLLLVTGTDLVFSWSTTLGLDGRTVHGLLAALAAPWSLLGDGAPSLATVEASQWVRMPGAFVRSSTPAELQLHGVEWSRFLAAAVFFYGMLPRLFALLLGGFWRMRAQRTAGLDHAGFHALYERLLPRDAGFSGPDPATVRGAPPAATGPRPATARAPHAPGASTVIVCWGSASRAAKRIAEAASARFSAAIVATLPGGGASLADDARSLHELGKRSPQRAIVVFAAGQQPTADALAFLRGARSALGANKPIVVLLAHASADGALADAEAEEHAIWQRSLGTLGDAYLWLETLGAAR